MTQLKPCDSSENQIQMSSVAVIQNPTSYHIYQNADLKHDFTQQVKRSDDFISQQLKELSKKSFMVIASCNQLGRFQDSKNKEIKRVNKKGSIIRAGDIIKFGRVPIMIKESSIDSNRHLEITREH